MSRVLIAGIGGIGRAVAQKLHSQGVKVHLVARNKDKLVALSNEIGGAPYTVADAADPEAFEAAVKAACGTEPLSGLVYAIGSIPLKPLKSTSAKDFGETYNLNFVSGALAVKAATPALSSGPTPGAVVMFSTVASQVGFPNHAAIAAAKGAVDAFVRSAAAELAPKVRLNAIAPSLTDTPLASRMTSSEAMRKALGDAHPIPRLGTPADGAALACLLLDDAAGGWVNGQTISMDGGRSTLRPKN